MRQNITPKAKWQLGKKLLNVQLQEDTHMSTH